MECYNIRRFHGRDAVDFATICQSAPRRYGRSVEPLVSRKRPWTDRPCDSNMSEIWALGSAETDLFRRLSRLRDENQRPGLFPAFQIPVRDAGIHQSVGPGTFRYQNAGL